MKRTSIIYFLVILALISVCPGLKSQNTYNGESREWLKVCTDRTMYISGEKALFSVVLCHQQDHPVEQISKAFYCELITHSGTRLTAGKYLLQNGTGHGILTIPEETVSGIYYLKFYTRFMRNGSTADYTYVMLKIINPYKTEVLAGNKFLDTTNQPKHRGDTAIHDQSLSITPGKKVYAPREEIMLNISRNSGKGMAVLLCLSVVPESTFDNQLLPTINPLNTDNSVTYLPETRGISLSGQLIGKKSGKPVPGAKVNLSIIGDKDILVVRTDSNGRFFFALPDYHWKKDIFLCADDLPDILPEIFIDNDFCSRSVDLSSPRFTLNDEEMKSAFKLAVNSRVRTVFRENILTADTMTEVNNTPFYGKPSGILVMDKYIDLPTLGEYFTELPVAVKLRKTAGKREFRFYTTQPDMALYAPLMLVDWVAVNNIEKILAMSPQEINRIELIDSLYIKGEITYGGIVSFVSKKNDFAGIDLPTSGTFVNYRFLEEFNENTLPDTIPWNIPDARNTVYWNPAVQTNPEGAAKVTFKAPDTPGKYTILLREITPSGEMLLTEESFVVTDR